MNEVAETDKAVSTQNTKGFPLVLIFLLAAFLVRGGAEAYFYSQDKAILVKELDRQGTLLLETTSAKKQLESIANKTAKLAEQGNQNAINVINQFKSAGIEIKQAGAN